MSASDSLSPEQQYDEIYKQLIDLERSGNVIPEQPCAIEKVCRT